MAMTNEVTSGAHENTCKSCINIFMCEMLMLRLINITSHYCCLHLAGSIILRKTDMIILRRTSCKAFQGGRGVHTFSLGSCYLYRFFMKIMRVNIMIMLLVN
jgi:hypothetical protein